MQNKKIDYKAIWENCENLPWCALVTTGRVGTDFFQSLLDSHPEIFVFNGILFFHEFWEKSVCANYPDGSNPDDIVDEFIGHHLGKLKSKYDLQERKNELGEGRNQSIDLDLDLFRTHLLNLIALRPVSSKNFLAGVYIAYSMCLGQDVMRKKLFFHHIHHIWKLDKYLHDFPESKILSMTRDPRATYVSGVEHWRKYNLEKDQAGHVFFVLNRTIEDAQPIGNYSNNFMVLRLEDTGSIEILTKVCEWFGVSYNQCMKKSTWGGMKWWGDRISTREKKADEAGFSPTITNNLWEEKLNRVDKLLLNFLLDDRLSRYQYEASRKSNIFEKIMCFFAILVPTVFEQRFLTPAYILNQYREKKIKNILRIPYYYSKRVSLFYKLFFRKFSGEYFNLKYFH